MIKDFATIDFETFYGSDFTLSKMQTDAYVLDPLFEIIGVSVKAGRYSEPEWYSGTEQHVKEFLRDTIDWATTPVCAHHTHFDGFIATQRLGLKPLMWLDTLSMVRMIYPWWKRYGLARVAEELGLGSKGHQVVQYKEFHRADFTAAQLADYGGYCNNDVALTHMIAELMLERTPLLELAIIDMTIRMFTEPQLYGDTERLIAYHQSELDRKKRLLEDAGVDKKILMSNNKLADLLVAHGVTPPTKLSPTTDKVTFAFAKTDKNFQALLEHPNEDVQVIVAARMGVKSTIAETRALRFVEASRRGALPVFLSHWGAKTTGRLSGGNKTNWQNLPMRGEGKELRNCIVAPDGYKVVVGDSSNIELRLAMVMAGQTDAVEKIRYYDALGDEATSDMYCDFSTMLHGRVVTNAEEDKLERLLGKVAMLSLQYGSGYVTFMQMVRTMAGITITEKEARRIVAMYRRTFDKVPDLWEYCSKRVLSAINNREKLVSVDVNGWFLTTEDGFAAPGHIGVVYKNLRKNREGDWVYDMTGKEVKIYGGKVVENLCIARDTEVLTSNGWKCIQHVLATDLVHDGVEFVTHGGLLYNGVKQTIAVDGVFMTPDHEVLSYDETWKTALEVAQPYRPNLRGVDSTYPCALGWKEKILGIPVLLWQRSYESWNRGKERSKARWKAKLWVHDQAAYISEKQDTRDEQTPCVLGMAEHERQVHFANTSGVAQLWRARYLSMRKVVRILRGVLGRYGRYISAWANVRSYRQQRWLFFWELPVGYQHRAELEPERQQIYKHTEGTHDGESCFAQIRHRAHNYTVSPEERLARNGATAEARPKKISQKVYDIANCGNRHRFVVRGDTGPLVVHNCQHAARHVVMWQTALVHRKYPVALSVHDEMVCVVPEDEAEACKAFMEDALKLAPKWCRGDLPLAGEVAIGDSYGGAK